MNPQIRMLAEKKLTGKHLTMSFSNIRTGELFRNFMPCRSMIQNKMGSDIFALEVYDPLFFDHFSNERAFEKWAAVEVSDFDTVPDGFETLLLPESLYAVFIHKGPASTGVKTYRYIFSEWLQQSGFLIDNRPHFAVMGEKYKHDDPDSEEEIWIPVRPKMNEENI